MTCQEGRPTWVAYADLILASEAFFGAPGLDARGKDLADANRIKRLVENGFATVGEVTEDAAAVRPLCHPDAKELCRLYLQQRQSSGTPVERRALAGMSLDGYLERLMTKRPLSFLGVGDSWVLRDGSCGSGFWEDIHVHDPESEAWVTAPWGEGAGNHMTCWARAVAAPADGKLRVRWDYDGKEDTVPLSKVYWHGRPPQLTMDEYLSYPEIQLSALLSVVVPVHFINDGARDNYAAPAAGGFERRGVYVAQVGCRLKKPNVQEYELLLATAEQNTFERGYGWTAPPEEHEDFMRRSLWSQWLWGRDSLPTYKEALADCSDRFARVADGVLLDTVGLRKRLRVVVEPLLLAANARAEACGLRAYVHCVGLGLGVWLGDCKTREGELEVALQQLAAYAEAVRGHSLPMVGLVDLSWFPEGCAKAAVKRGLLAGRKGVSGEAVLRDMAGREVPLTFSQRNPAEPVPTGHFLVAQYAWDGNAFPGNEYWMGQRNGSGDSAAASCSTIGELQNPMINARAFQDMGSKLEVLGGASPRQRLEQADTSPR